MRKTRFTTIQQLKDMDKIDRIGTIIGKIVVFSIGVALAVYGFNQGTVLWIPAIVIIVFGILAMENVE